MPTIKKCNTPNRTAVLAGALDFMNILSPQYDQPAEQVPDACMHDRAEDGD